jgi:hypothetical protein
VSGLAHCPDVVFITMEGGENMRNFFIRLVIEFSLALARELAKLIRKGIKNKIKKPNPERLENVKGLAKNLNKNR